MYTLVIANRKYSSWSLRAWPLLIESKILFEEIRNPLFTGSWQEKIARINELWTDSRKQYGGAEMRVCVDSFSETWLNMTNF